MSRELTGAMSTAMVAEVVVPVLLYEGDFEGGIVRLHSGIGPITWDGQTWTGGGHLLTISPLGENSELRAEGFEVRLSGMPTGNLEVALANMRQGRRGKLWLALMSGETIIADPYELQDGKLDVSVVTDDGETCTIAVRYENVLIDLDTPRDRRYTNEDQQIDFPGDTGFRYMSKLQDATIIWGGPGAAASAMATPIPLTNAR